MHAGAPPGAPRYRVMVTVPFQTAMSDSDIHPLTRVLGIEQKRAPKLHSGPASPVMARLDFFSARFLSCSEGRGVATGGPHVGRAGAGERARLACSRG
jgi:hypothetical protein